jgi:hypothetical protein
MSRSNVGTIHISLLCGGMCIQIGELVGWEMCYPDAINRRLDGRKTKSDHRSMLREQLGATFLRSAFKRSGYLLEIVVFLRMTFQIHLVGGCS